MTVEFIELLKHLRDAGHEIVVQLLGGGCVHVRDAHVPGGGKYIISSLRFQ